MRRRGGRRGDEEKEGEGEKRYQPS